MGINPNTIQRAYQILETEGYITTIEKKGVYVAYKKEDAKALLKDKVKKEISIIKQSNISKEELLQIVEEVYNDWPTIDIEGGDDYDYVSEYRGYTSEQREEQEARWVLMTEDYQEANIEEVEMNEEL